jgi:endonuclease/exonuclease/phosphatase family metal-dependent hydrolase
MRPLATAPTFPVHAPQRQIDHILGDGPITATASRSVDTGLSDHRALVADVVVG